MQSEALILRSASVRPIRLARAELLLKVAYGILAIPLTLLTLLTLHAFAQNAYANAQGIQQLQPLVPILVEALGPLALWSTGLLGFRLTRESRRSWLWGAVAFLATLAVALIYRLTPFVVYVLEHTAR